MPVQVTMQFTLPEIADAIYARIAERDPTLIREGGCFHRGDRVSAGSFVSVSGRVRTRRWYVKVGYSRQTLLILTSKDYLGSPATATKIDKIAQAVIDDVDRNIRSQATALLQREAAQVAKDLEAVELAPVEEFRDTMFSSIAGQETRYIPKGRDYRAHSAGVLRNANGTYSIRVDNINVKDASEAVALLRYIFKAEQNPAPGV